jgi:predicted DNA-binding transcriptional regulator AlpA
MTPPLRDPQPTVAPTSNDLGLDPFIKPAPTGRLALRLDEVAAALGLSRRSLERERSAGRFPPPDRTIRRMPLWSPETIRRWVEGGGPR